MFSINGKEGIGNMADENFYVRVKISDDRRGFKVSRYHFAGHLFVGGDRPVWYRVHKDLANLCRQDIQENGVPTFDVVSGEEKVAIDTEEEKRRLVMIGLVSATTVAPRGTQAIDLRAPELAAVKGSARLGAVPEAGSGDLTSADLNKR